jgi:hypothetical protein
VKFECFWSFELRIAPFSHVSRFTVRQAHVPSLVEGRATVCGAEWEVAA